MPKTSMNDMLKRRMTATQQASELQTSNEAYEKLFQQPPTGSSRICDLPLDRLLDFLTADIGFKPYSATKLAVFRSKSKGIFDYLFISS